jgi:hypothetical protein
MPRMITSRLAVLANGQNCAAPVPAEDIEDEA